LQAASGVLIDGHGRHYPPNAACVQRALVDAWPNVWPITRPSG
jgi:hypothetical protein